MKDEHTVFLWPLALSEILFTEIIESFNMDCADVLVSTFRAIWVLVYLVIQVPNYIYSSIGELLCQMSLTCDQSGSGRVRKLE